MAYIQLQPIDIEIDIPDVILSSTILKRRAKLFTMTYNQKSKSLILNWQVTFYSDDNGAYGPVISLPGVTTYTKESIADNSTIVDLYTGQILSEVTTIVQTIIPEQTIVISAAVYSEVTIENPDPILLEPEVTQVIPEHIVSNSVTGYPGDYTGQYDWFNMVAENQDLNVHNMIRIYGSQVNWTI